MPQRITATPSGRLIENFRDIGYEVQAAVADLMDYSRSLSCLSHVVLAHWESAVQP